MAIEGEVGKMKGTITAGTARESYRTGTRMANHVTIEKLNEYCARPSCFTV